MEYLELYREKLSNGIHGFYDESTKMIRFDDNTVIPGETPLTMVRPTTTTIDVAKIPTGDQFDMAKHYSFASLALLIASTSTGTQLAQYINQARKMRVMHLPFMEGKSTVAFLKGEIDDCDLLMNVLLSTDKIARSIKRKKIADLSATAFVQLTQGGIQANEGFVLANSPTLSLDFITMMKSLYTESGATYISESGLKRKADKIGAGEKEGAVGSGIANAAAPTIFKPENPIIIVPSAQTLTFNFKNLGDLFAHGKFLKSNEPDSAFAVQPESIVGDGAGGVKNGRGAANHNIKKITRPSLSRPGSTSTFELCSDPEALTPSQWNRVIGVVVTGKAYQLEAFVPYTKDSEVNTPALFDNIAGIYLYFDGDKIPPTIQQWNVSTHKFSLSKRHQDEIVMSEVWDKIIQFCKQRQRTNPNLFF